MRCPREEPLSLVRSQRVLCWRELVLAQLACGLLLRVLLVLAPSTPIRPPRS